MDRIKNGKTFFFDLINTQIGLIYLVFQEQILIALTYEYPLDVQWKRTVRSEQTINEIEEYLAGKIQTFSTHIRFLRGTMFQRKVWKALSMVPYGETRTYKWLAEKVGKPASARAVGQALRINPVPIIIPCHRIVCSNKKLGGYSSGIARKEFLLRLEKNKRADD